jgi:hypothetical protein
MGIAHTFTDANFAGSPAPKYIKRISGFPTPDLVGLYLLQDGTVGQPMPSSLANAVAGSSHPTATRNAGHPAPIQRSYGMELTPAAQLSLYDTGLPIAPSFTVVFAGRCTSASTATSQFPTYVRPKANNIIGLNVLSLSGNAQDGNWGAFLNTGTTFRDNLAGSNGRLPSVFAMRFDGETGHVTARDHTGRSIEATHAAAAHFLDDVTDQWQFGFYHGSTTMTGEEYAIAFYASAIADDLMTDAINAAKAVPVGAGLTMAP